MDHSTAKKRKQNPRETANLFSLFTFVYTGSIFKRAYERDLDKDDLYDVVSSCKSNKLGNALEEKWNEEKVKENPKSIYRILWNMFYVRYFLLGAMELTFKIVKSLLEPKAFENLIAFFNEDQKKFTKNDAYYNAGLVVFFSFFTTIFYYNVYLYFISIGIEMRTCFSAFLYRKTLKLSPAALSEISFGNIVTLITRDVQTFERGIFFLNDLWTGLIHTSVVCYLLYARIGATTFTGISLFLGVIPLQIYLGKILKKLRMKTCKKTDERLEETQEALSMIRIIKMYTWEEYFIRKINLARKAEINKMLAGFYLKMMIYILGILVSRLGFYILVMAYIWMDHPPDSSVIFFIMSNYNDIKYFFGYVLPDEIGHAAEFMSAINRLNKVLNAEEVPTAEIECSKKGHPKIELHNVTISMKEERILKNISFKLKPGLTSITGPVGSGKSTLLKTILYNFPITDGHLTIMGDISYASQDPWLFESSIKQNILFGEEFNPNRYQEVLRVCALEYDFSLFSDGDETILSDNGLNLSKGQQARVNLARAVYRNCDIYLLDDSLTSLDNHVSEFIFEECIKKFLRGKFCILVTQTERHLKEADRILVVKKGEIDKIIDPSRDYKNVNNEINKISENINEIKSKIDENDEVSSETQKLLETEQNLKRKDVFEETLKKGSVSIKNYKKYITFGGGILVILIYCIVSGFNQFASSYSDKLLTKWVDEQQKFLNIKGNVSKYEVNATFPIIVPKNESMLYLNLTENLKSADTKQSQTFSWYYGMLLASTGLEIVKTFIMFDFCRKASINIHVNLIKKIFNAVMLFFDTHYIGVILNRLSQDLVNMDENMCYLLNYTFESVYYIVGSLVLIISVNYYFLIYIGIVTVCMVFMGRIYLPFGRGMKRLEVSTRSPILGHLKSTFQGLTTIRAFKAESILINEYDRYHDVYTSSHYTLIVGQIAYGFFTSALTSFLVTFVVGTFIFLETGTSAGNVGLALSQIFSIGYIIIWVIRQYIDLESMMTSVERIFEYTEIETENQTGSMAKNWPQNGAVQYDKVSLKYNSSDIILNNLNFDLLSKQKIGIVGRTGAGKSSIISTFFRLYDVKGRILIDDIDIKTVPLKHLRQNLAIIPQDPVLFSGTIRSNLDPFGQFGDDDLWKLLEKVHLKGSVMKLDTEISSRASNFSMGQKQMICIARAILTKAKVLILDEATANLDQEAENMINDVIKDNFSECTVIVIAHRLRSILECDKVMVLDRGEIKEFDSPSKLMENQDGYFYKVVKKYL